MRIYVKSQWNCTKLNGFKLLQTSQFSRPFPSSFFSFFFLPFLYLWIKNTRRHHRRCWIFPVQNVYRSVNKLRRGATWRDHSTKPNSRHPTRECWAWNSSSQLSCCYTWIRLLQLDDPRLDVVVLLTRRLWCGRVSGDVVVSARFSQFVDGKWTKKMSLCERNYHSAPTTPGADKTKQKRHTDHLELIRCRWWQGAVSANTRGGSK